MKYLTVIVVVLATLLTACDTKIDRERRIAEEAGVPQGGIEHLSEISFVFTLLSIERVTNLIPFTSSERLSGRLGEVQEIWCGVVSPTTDSEYDSVPLVLFLSDDNWDSFVLSVPLLETDQEVFEIVVEQSNCKNWKNWSENQ